MKAYWPPKCGPYPMAINNRIYLLLNLCSLEWYIHMHHICHWKNFDQQHMNSNCGKKDQINRVIIADSLHWKLVFHWVQILKWKNVQLKMENHQAPASNVALVPSLQLLSQFQHQALNYTWLLESNYKNTKIQDTKIQKAQKCKKYKYTNIACRRCLYFHHCY